MSEPQLGMHYGNPDIFRPECWIVNEEIGNTANEISCLSTAFHPFLSRFGNCVRQNLAILEMLTVIRRTLWRFDVRLASGFNLGDVFVSMRNGPLLHFRKRKL